MSVRRAIRLMSEFGLAPDFANRPMADVRLSHRGNDRCRLSTTALRHSERARTKLSANSFRSDSLTITEKDRLLSPRVTTNNKWVACDNRVIITWIDEFRCPLNYVLTFATQECLKPIS